MNPMTSKITSTSYYPRRLTIFGSFVFVSFVFLCFIFLIVTLFAESTSVAQDDYSVGYDESGQPQSSGSEGAVSTVDPSKPRDDTDDSIIRQKRDTSTVEPRVFSKKEKDRACRNLNGKLMSIGGDMWRIKDCKRHHVLDSDNVFEMTRKGVAVVEVDSRDAAAIPVGPTWEELQAKKPRPCSAFNKRYVTVSFTEIFFVENCKRRLMPDYETYVEHRRKNRALNQEILALSSNEFYWLKQGPDIDSVTTREFAKLLDGSPGVDLIPLDEACKGLNGKLVSFYSKLYRIEKCRKKELDAEEYTRKAKGSIGTPRELTPEQWISIPDR